MEVESLVQGSVVSMEPGQTFAIKPKWVNNRNKRTYSEWKCPGCARYHGCDNANTLGTHKACFTPIGLIPVLDEREEK